MGQIRDCRKVAFDKYSRRVAQAQAALDSLLAQRKEMTLVAPIDGILLSLLAHPGEVAAPGDALLSMADLSKVELAA